MHIDKPTAKQKIKNPAHKQGFKIKVKNYLLLSGATVSGICVALVAGAG